MQFTKTKNEFEYAGIVWNDYTTPEIVRRSEKFQFRPSDICVCGFPRSGTTLTQEIVWHIVNRTTIKKGEKYGDLDERFPFLEFNYKWGGNPAPFAVDVLESTPPEQLRLIKTHCPLSLIGHNILPAKPRIICVVRNPKDCLVSLYKFYVGHEMYGPWPGDLDEFVELFLHGKTFSGDYFKVVPEWWEQRNLPNVLFLKYEDLVKRREEEVTRIAEFLAMPLTSEQLETVLLNTSFDSMSKNENVNFTTSTGFQFIRRGVVGDWRRHLNEGHSEKIDAAVNEKLKPHDIQFEYD